MNAFLILEDGHVFEGKSFGAQKEVICEPAGARRSQSRMAEDPRRLAYQRHQLLHRPVQGSQAACHHA